MAGCRVGSPPDDFSPKGQDWGFPPPNSERHREDGYRLFAESIRKNCRHGGALRIDHVMRLFRLYWIPDENDAMDGAYVGGSSDDLVRILALESVRNQVVIVGEDLGTVEPAVRETLAQFGILSYRLFYFEKNPGGGFRALRRVSQVSAGLIHDARPADAGRLLDRRRHRSAARRGSPRRCGLARADGEPRASKSRRCWTSFSNSACCRATSPRSAADYAELTGELHNAIVGFLAQTPSQLLAINQEDLTKEPAQQNLPGTTWQYPNWGRKMRFTDRRIAAPTRTARNFTAMARNWIVNSGRRNHSAR